MVRCQHTLDHQGRQNKRVTVLHCRDGVGSSSVRTAELGSLSFFAGFG